MNENARFLLQRQEYLMLFKVVLCYLNTFVSILLMTFRALPLCVLFPFLFLATHPSTADEKVRWFKGNTHTHSLWSDGNDFPEMIAKFYKDNNYHFLEIGRAHV